MDKKFQFDLNIASPNDAIVGLLEAAGYHIHSGYTDCADCYVVRTEECANSKEDIFKFIENINQLSGLNLELVDEDLIEEDHEVHFHTEDGMFGGIIHFPGMTDDGRLPDVDDIRFQLAYSEDCIIFT